jgi:ABC-type nitrate/sulfonate/bicarbonate transport system substrate-binding protein
VTVEEERETVGRAISSEVITGHNAGMSLQRRSLMAAALAASALLPATEPRAQSEDKLEKVEILLDWKALPTCAGFYLARQIGAFEGRGLEVKFAETQGALSSAATIGEGKQYWIGSLSGIATAIGRSKGQPIKSLAVYYPKTPTVIFTRTEDRIAHPRDLLDRALGRGLPRPSRALMNYERREPHRPSADSA